MPVTWQRLYAERTEGMRASDIREILKVTGESEFGPDPTSEAAIARAAVRK